LAKDKFASRAIRGAIVSADNLSRETGMISSGDAFCGSSRITRVTSSTVTVSKVDRVDEQIRGTGGCTIAGVDVSLLVCLTHTTDRPCLLG